MTKELKKRHIKGSFREFVALSVLSAMFMFFSCESQELQESLVIPRHDNEQELPASSPRKDMTLEALQVAYDVRDIYLFNRFIDADFIFFFSERDVPPGTMPVWGRSEEISATQEIFSRPSPAYPTATFSLSTNGSRIIPQIVEERTWGSIKAYFYDESGDDTISIDLDMDYPAGDETWLPFTPPPPYTEETWYQKDVTYSLVLVEFTDPQKIFVAINIQARFIIRMADVGGEMTWRIVQWHDDIQ